MYDFPDVEDFKDYFDRGQFVYGEEYPAVRDKDIESAMDEARSVFNAGLFTNEKTFKMAFLYLTAHFTASDFDAAQSGGRGSTGFIQTSRSADGISESLSVPSWINSLDDPVLSLLTSTYFGRKYLALATGSVHGTITAIGGRTLA